MKRIEFTYHLFHAILTMLSVWFATAGMVQTVSGADFSDTSLIENRLAAVESRIDAIESKLEEKQPTRSTEEIYDIYDDNRYEVVEILLESPKLSLADAVDLFMERGGPKEKPKAKPAVRKSTPIKVRTAQVSHTHSGPGHTHRCGACGASWSHENWNVGNPSAHTCPNCGNLEWGNRTEGWQSSRRSSTPAYRVISRPQVYWSSAPSYGSSCPGGVCPTYR